MADPAHGRRVRWPAVAAAAALVCLHGEGFDAAQQRPALADRQILDLGRRAAEEIERQHPVLTDAFVTTFVESVAARLSTVDDDGPRVSRLVVLDVPEVQAFALPGGFVYVTRGLIEATEGPSELAGVLAHELGHLAGEHWHEQLRSGAIAGAGARLLDLLPGSGAREAAVAALTRLLTSDRATRHSVQAEREADGIGALLAHDAGYDPAGFVRFLERLERLRSGQPALVAGFLAAHPDPIGRAAHVEAFAASLPDLIEDADERQSFDEVRTRLLGLAPAAASLPAAPLPETLAVPATEDDRDLEIAAIFAPAFHQALGTSPRFDYITNFDFDGDWRGDNNWRNAANPDIPLRAWIYYSVSETRTHAFIHYAAFHPRDYKGGPYRGAILSDLIREGVRRGSQFDPTGRALEAVLAHENDLEGCLVVVEKTGGDATRGRIVFVETLAHNQFLKYVPAGTDESPFPPILVQGTTPLLYVEPRGHGIEAWRGDAAQTDVENGIITYRFTGRAEDPGRTERRVIGYDLAPIAATLWPRAWGGDNQTYAEPHDYGTVVLEVDRGGRTREWPADIGVLGSAFRGEVGGRHMARPPWGWFDWTERDRPLGEWFFDPAATIAQHYEPGPAFSTVYVHHPILGVQREE